MYTLYWNPSASSLVAMAVLEEIGADYEGVLIDAGAGEHRTSPSTARSILSASYRRCGWRTAE